MQVNKQYKKSIFLFIAITCVYILNSLVLRYLYLDGDLYVNSIIEKYNSEYAQEIINIEKQWGFVKYLFTPIEVFFRVTIVVFIFYLGLYLAGIKGKLVDLYEVVLLGEFAFLFFILIRTGLIFNHEFTSLSEIGNYAPFRFIKFERINNFPIWIKIPMTVINPVEIFYWLILSYLLTIKFKWNYFKSMKFITQTYVVGLSIWIVFLIFINVVLKNKL